MLQRLLAVFVLFTIGLAPASCSRNAVTGESSLLVLSKDDE